LTTSDRNTVVRALVLRMERENGLATLLQQSLMKNEADEQ